MGATRDQMLEEAEKEQRQEFLNSLIRDKAEEIYNIIEQEGFGRHQFLYVLCGLLVGASTIVGFTPEEIQIGVESMFQQDN